MNSPIESLPAADAQSGISVRPTTPADTAEICDLLEHGFVGSGIAADGWRPLCTTNWGADNPPRGFVLTDGGRIVGYLGTIYVQREINGKTGIVCNYSSYYVAPAYRGRGLAQTLVAAAVRDERITYISHTPAPPTRRALESVGFAILDRGVLLFPLGLNAETLWQSRVDIDVNDRTVRASLGQAERRIYDDHASYDCLQMTARDAGGTAYLVVKRRLVSGVCAVGVADSVLPDTVLQRAGRACAQPRTNQAGDHVATEDLRHRDERAPLTQGAASEKTGGHRPIPVAGIHPERTRPAVLGVRAARYIAIWSRWPNRAPQRRKTSSPGG